MPLFTWFFVLACHIVSLTDDTVSLWAHNEEVVKEHRLRGSPHSESEPELHRFYTRLCDAGLYLVKKKVNHCFSLYFLCAVLTVFIKYEALESKIKIRLMAHVSRLNEQSSLHAV